MDASAENQHTMKIPTTDNEYFEHMCRIIFTSGLNWKMVEHKWPAIKHAFKDFDVTTVATFLEPEIEAVMADPDIIHNLPKVRATVKNAQQFKAIAEEYGSFKAYLAATRKKGDEEAFIKSVSQQFSFLGKSTTMFFLFGVGEELPLAHQQWMKQHNQSA